LDEQPLRRKIDLFSGEHLLERQRVVSEDIQIMAFFRHLIDLGGHDDIGDVPLTEYLCQPIGVEAAGDQDGGAGVFIFHLG